MSQIVNLDPSFYFCNLEKKVLENNKSYPFFDIKLKLRPK